MTNDEYLNRLRAELAHLRDVEREASLAVIEAGQRYKSALQAVDWETRLRETEAVAEYLQVEARRAYRIAADAMQRYKDAVKAACGIKPVEGQANDHEP